jgi:hypothetical protein
MATRTITGEAHSHAEVRLLRHHSMLDGLNDGRTQPASLAGTGNDHDNVKNVRSWMSANRGKTWHALRVRNPGRAWSARVTNPASGWVSLRARVVDTRGNAVTTQITRAYAVD